MQHSTSRMRHEELHIDPKKHAYHMQQKEFELLQISNPNGIITMQLSQGTKDSKLITKLNFIKKEPLANKIDPYQLNSSEVKSESEYSKSKLFVKISNKNFSSCSDSQTVNNQHVAEKEPTLSNTPNTFIPAENVHKNSSLQNY